MKPQKECHEEGRQLEPEALKYNPPHVVPYIEMEQDEAQMFFALLFKELVLRFLFFGKADRLTKAYLPIVYANGETALGIGAYPGFVGDGGTISTIV
jgi:hypothetical protein